MNAAETSKLLAWHEKHKNVLKAFALGEVAQYQNGETWIDVSSPSWDYETNYRIKPTPRTILMIEYVDACGQVKFDQRPTWTRKDCEDACIKWNSEQPRHNYRVVEFLEQL